MLFTNPRQIIKQPTVINKPPPPQNVNFPMMGFSKQYIAFQNKQTSDNIQSASNSVNTNAVNTRVLNTKAVIKKEVITPPENAKPIRWGAPTWFLFHTLAEKIKDEHFLKLRKELLDIIYSICVNLPCPICSKHAREYMSGINFNTITTKEQLKQLLFVFHNSVNERKHFPLFSKIELDEKYSKSNTVAIIQNFMQHFQNKSYNIKLIADDLQRKQLLNHLSGWFSKNIQYFN